VETAAVQQHRQPHGERVPVERYVEDEREGADVARVAAVAVPRRVLAARERPRRRSSGAIAPKATRRTGATGLSARRRASSAATSAGAAVSALVTSRVSATAACLRSEE